MRNLYAPIITLLLMCFSPVILHAQNAPWLEVGSEWIYQHGSFGGPEHSQVKYGITEETTFAGKECIKMEQLSNLGLGCMGLHPPFYFYVSNDSLFYANDELDEFRLAIHFGAEPGDSWEFVTGHGDFTTSFMVLVNSVSTVEIEGYPLRQLNVTYEYDNEDLMYDYIYPETMDITEVIGAPYMFFVPMGHGSACDYETNVTFQCFESPSFSYLNPEYPSCEYVVGIEESPSGQSLNIFPNPARDIAQIEIPEQWQSHRGMVQLHNSTGQLVYEHAAVLSSFESIPVEDLSRGMYLLSIQSGEGRGLAKLVIE